MCSNVSSEQKNKAADMNRSEQQRLVQSALRQATSLRAAHSHVLLESCTA